jgi:hypothetical protein
MPKKRTLPTKYIPESMRTLLLFGCYDDRDVNESFDAFMISIHKDLIVKEWEKFREQLYPEWKHSLILPYGECLLQGIKPDRLKLRELYDTEVKA